MKKWLKIAPGLFRDLIFLIYPNVCQACERQLFQGERVICIFCQYKLPQTNYHRELNNPVAKHFWGRVPIARATSFYFYTKGGKVQTLIYKMKYQGRKEIGIRMGQLFGGVLKEESVFSDVDIILPVPLHFSKERKRGFNQCDLIAEGLSQVLDIPWSPKILIRKDANVSQTGKSRYSRWENVDQIFGVRKGKKLEGKTVLLIDDVVTTGSTLEACAQALLTVPDVRICIATIACAH